MFPHTGRSPDFLQRRISLPGFPVITKTAQVHSDGIAPDFHRIPFSHVDYGVHLYVTNTVYSIHPHYTIIRKAVPAQLKVMMRESPSEMRDFPRLSAVFREFRPADS